MIYKRSYSGLFLCLLVLLGFETNIIAHNGNGYRVGKTRTFDLSASTSKSPLQIQQNIADDWDDIDIVPDEIKKKEAKVKEIERLVSSQKRFIEKLDAATIMEYPVGIVKTFGNSNYTILLNQDEITPQGATLNAYMSFPVPQSTDSLSFSATGIPLSSDGGFSGDIKLVLLSSHYINLGNNVRLKILGGENKSYVTFNCNGFKNMTISAEVEFAGSVFLCEDPTTGNILPNKKLKSEFSITIENWNNLLVELSVAPFQIKGINGVGFEANRVALDFSDYANPTGVVFPEAYQSSYFADGNPNLWRGLYIQQAIVRLPSEFNKKNGSADNKSSTTTASGNSSITERTSISANNLIIDKMGITGNFSANHLFESGDMNGWGFSVDKFSMHLEANSIKEASFSGRLEVPMLDSALNYSAIIGMDGDYSFIASTTKANKFGLWAADLTLAPNSSIIIKSVNGKFMPEAILHGELVINASLKGGGKEKDKTKGVSLADIKFQDLHLQTVSPYVKVGAFSFGSEKADQMMAGFPLQIKEIGAETSGNELALKLRIILNIADGGFGADGSFRIIAEQNQNKWRFKTVEVDQASIDLVTGPLKMKGSIIFFKNDSTYGNGFQGSIQAEFSMGIKLQANTMFGKVKGMRYWYADAQAEISNGIPIFTGISIYGFGGGACYHMKQAGFASANDKMGKTLSGLVYKPDVGSGLGLKASVVIGSSPTKEAFNGEAGFEIAFNSGGGIKFITFTGKASFISPPIPDALKSIVDGAKKLGVGKEAVSSEPDSRGSINASLYISYNFTNNTLDGNLKTFVNIGGIITGVGPNNSAGEAVLHFAPKEWYIYIGTPDNPIGLKFLGLAETRSYFMVGTKIPGSPPPSAEVSSILGGINTDYMKELNSLGTGKGIAFGSSFRINSGDLNFLIFYASFKAGMGFDVMLKDYGNATCQGSSSPLGIGGWYANGQAYAYVEGKIGIKVKIFRINKSVNILDIAMAALLQAKLPNPTWLHGAVGGNFSVLGGVVKGSCKFEFTLGEECKIAGGSALSGTEIIAEVTPGNAQTDISVFNAPQAVFNYAVERPFELMETDNAVKKYRVKLDYFEVSEGVNKIVCNAEWNNDHNVLALKPGDILPGKKKLKAKVGVSFEEFKNGSWSAVYENGSKVTETKETEFETGIAPDFIPPSNVQYSYPVINQYNYYKDETSIGYIKLKQGQDYLFEPVTEWRPKGRFVSLKTGNKLLCNIAYDNANNEVSFNRPDGLASGEAYRFELVNIPANAAAEVDANVSSMLTKSGDLSEGNDVVTKTQQVEGVMKDVKEKVFYSSNLRTSKHNTFKSKLQAFANSPTYLDYLRVNVEFISLYSWNSEPFDLFEKYGKANEFAPLVKAQANLENTAWYNNLIYPSVYKDYPMSSNFSITDRDAAILGVPPVRAIDNFQLEKYAEMSTDMASTESVLNKTSELVTFDYNLASAIDFDAGELKTKVANSLTNGGAVTSRIKSLLEYVSPLLTKGNYYLDVSYTLPAKNITTSTVQLCMKIK